MLDNTLDGGAVVEGDAEGVGTRGEIVDVNLVGVIEDGDHTSAWVEDFHFGYIVSVDGDFSCGGVGEECDVAVAVGDVYAHFSDG